MAYSEFGLWLKGELARKNMKQRELSLITGINEKVISDLIVGKNNKEAHKDLIKQVLYEGQQIYDNKDKMCECWKCELKSTCPYVDKYQRLPRNGRGTLGLCKKLNVEDK